MIDSILNAFTALLANPRAVAVFLGLVIAWGGTQFLKFQLGLPSRWTIRVVSLLLGFVPTFIMWPGMLEERVLWALGVAVSAPFVYRLLTWGFLYRFWPELENRLSADPYRDLSPRRRATDAPSDDDAGQ